jgi:hypothetical protein
MLGKRNWLFNLCKEKPLLLVSILDKGQQILYNGQWGTENLESDHLLIKLKTRGSVGTVLRSGAMDTNVLASRA